MNDVTTTEEVVVAVLEVKEAVVENAEVQVVAVLNQEKKADSKANEAQLQEKVALEVTEVRLQKKVVLYQRVLEQKENQVHHNEKESHQDVLKVTMTNVRQVVHLKPLKAEDLERAKAYSISCKGNFNNSVFSQ